MGGAFCVSRMCLVCCSSRFLVGDADRFLRVWFILGLVYEMEF